MNKLKQFRESRLMSRAELGRLAGISPVTIDRIEKGFACQVGTQRKILAALGLSVEDKGLVFEERE